MPLYPTGGPRPTSSEAERTFYRALQRHLPASWSAWHSLRVRVGASFEGEGDFVIAVPDRAILLVEVKGGAIECRDGLWFQNGRPMEHAPRDQAHRFRRILDQKLEATYRGARPPIFIVTAFPDTPFQAPPSHGDLAHAVLGQQDLPWLGDALASIVEKHVASFAPVKDDGWTSALHRIWGETWVPHISLGTRIKLRAHELAALDADQARLIEMLDHSTRLLVKGGPGTGKTLLARALCERRERPLYLCWTRALAARMRASGLANAWAVREYAAHLLAEAGVEIQGGAPAEAWTTETWNTVALAAAIDAVPRDADKRHGIVVIDEAQDLTDNDWELSKALAGDGPMWAFGDAGQSFWTERAIPKDLFGAELALKSRYRCPEPLAAFADRYRPDAAGDMAPAPGGPAFPELRVVTPAQHESVLDRVRLEVTRALKDGAKPEDLAVLSLMGQTKSALAKCERLGDVRVVRADAPDADDHVIADTFLRFKGLERPHVIVTELGAGEKYDVRMHVALTRATVSAVVVGTEAEIASDPRLRGRASS